MGLGWGKTIKALRSPGSKGQRLESKAEDVICVWWAIGLSIGHVSLAALQTVRAVCRVSGEPTRVSKDKPGTL